MRDDRGNWYLLTALVLGLALGLLISWKLYTVSYVNTEPKSLRDDFKDQYRALIAAAYAANNDLEAARARLAYIGDEDPAAALTEQAQRVALSNRPQAEVAAELSALTRLASAIEQPPTPSPAAPIASPSSPPEGAEASPSSTPTVEVTPTLVSSATPSPVVVISPGAASASPAPRNPTRTPTPLPTRTPTPTPGAPFVLQRQLFVCNQKLPQPLIQVQTRDAASQPVPGVEIVVAWQDGEEHFFTGLKPELGLGYADFTMTPGVVYSLRLAEGGETLNDLTPQECETVDGTRYWGSWLLMFVQP